MRSTLLLSALAALAVAAPRPQDIEFDQVDAADPPETVAAPVDVTDNTVDIQPVSEAIAIAVDSVTSSSKRDFLGPFVEKRAQGDCTAQPAGTGPAVTTPDDTPGSFLGYLPFQNTALNAQTPQGYTLAFQNLTASTQTTSYLGYKTLTSYDPIACASYCDQLSGCSAFNLYYERDPSLYENSTTCPNPPSITNIKCVRWGVQISPTTATNVGQCRAKFQVVISGSNGYNKLAAPASQPGFTGPVELGGAINAPCDPITKQDTYIGYNFFSFADVQTYANGVAACMASCTAQSQFDVDHNNKAPANPDICNQAVVYVLSFNNQPQGIYCAHYTQAWAPQYATNYGQHRDGGYYSVSQAYSYTNNTYAAKYPSICGVGGCPTGGYKGGNCGGWGAGTC